MKTSIQTIKRKSVSLLTAGFAAAVLLSAGANVSHAQVLPPGVQDVVKLAQSGLSDEIILSQIRNTGAIYNLTADQIIFLKNEGVSQPVIKALLAGASVPASATIPPASVSVTPLTPPASGPPVPLTTPAASATSLDGYQTQLAPYGTWIEVPGYGQCWQPAVATTDLSWRPYFNQGHWLYTDAGWAWQSDYAWGGVVFHYGRWSRFNEHWVWVPGYDYAPAWVCWREADGYCGWAPLPPAATFKAGIGLYFNGHVALDVDFGLDMGVFNFVAYDHFWDHDLHPFLLPRERLELVFRSSRVANGYRVDHGRLVIEGLGHDHMATLTHREVVAERGGHDSHFQEPKRGAFDDHRNHDDRGDKQHSW